MGQKVHPIGFRLGITSNWKSRWLRKKSFRFFLQEDFEIREWLAKHFPKGTLATAEIERSGDSITVILRTAKPGLVIGRGGTGLEDLKKTLEKIVKKLRLGKRYAEGKWNLKLEVQEIKKPEMDAEIVAQNVASELERRIPFRRVMKSTIERVMQQKGVEGVKIILKGRLDGSEMARNERLGKGKIPAQTLRANLDFGQSEALTTYGVIGVKVWIYKGEIFADAQNQK